MSTSANAADDALVSARVVRLLGPGLFLSWSAQLVIGQATVRLVQQHSAKGRWSGTPATNLATLTSLCALSQFILNQPLGALSDTYGRKPMLLAISMLTAVVRGVTALRPDSWTALVCDRLIGVL